MVKKQRNYELTVQVGTSDYQTIKMPFTIEFDIERNILSSANNATIKIYNLNPNVRNLIYKDENDFLSQRTVELKAGYGEETTTAFAGAVTGSNLPTVFKGTIMKCNSVRQGVDFITTITAQDGGFAFISGTTEEQFTAGMNLNGVLNKVLTNLPGVKVGAVGPSYLTKTLPRGNTYNGNSADIANTVSGGGFFVDLERAYCLGDNECIIGPLQIIDTATGLLGTPVREKTFLTFDMLFEPRLLIGQMIILDSSTGQNFNGIYKVVGIHHKGTISKATSGTAITSVSLFYGTQFVTTVTQS